MDKDLKSYTALELRHLVEKYGRKPFLADYLFAFIHQKRVLDLNAVTPLPAAFREQLIGDGYFISSLTLAEQHHDPDGTTKLAFDVSGGGRIEAVRLSDRERQTLCLSTQVGCRMGCSFCATGRLGFERNLTAAQIVDQVYQAQQLCGPIHNVVYMGMGEPLDNLDEVMRSVELLTMNAACISVFAVLPCPPAACRRASVYWPILRCIRVWRSHCIPPMTERGKS